MEQRTIRVSACRPGPRVTTSMQPRARHRPDPRTSGGHALILFPELFARPFWCVGLATLTYFEWAESLSGTTLSTLAAEARARRAYIAVPFFERGEVDGEYLNSVAILGPDGAVRHGPAPRWHDGTTFRKTRCPAITGTAT